MPTFDQVYFFGKIFKEFWNNFFRKRSGLHIVSLEHEREEPITNGFSESSVEEQVVSL